jgi:hypothetical protein
MAVLLRVSLEAPASLAVRWRGIDLLPDLSTQTVTEERDGVISDMSA